MVRPGSTRHNKHVHGVFTGTVQCLQNTTNMSMACLQGQSSFYKNTTNMSMACLQGQSIVYKMQETCSWRVYRDSSVSTKNNKHVHCVFTGTVPCLQNTTNMSMVFLQGQLSVYKTQQIWPLCVYRESPLSIKHNKHVHGVFTGTVQCLQNTTNMSTAYLQGQHNIYKTQQTCPWGVYRDSSVSTKHNKHVHGVFTGTVQCLQNTTNMSMACLQGQHNVYIRHNKHVYDLFTGTAQCL